MLDPLAAAKAPVINFEDFTGAGASDLIKDRVLMVAVTMLQLCMTQADLMVTMRDDVTSVTDDMARMNGLMQKVNQTLAKLSDNGDADSENVVTGAAEVDALVAILVARGVDTTLYQVSGEGDGKRLDMTKANATKINGNLQIAVDTLSSTQNQRTTFLQGLLSKYNSGYEVILASLKKFSEMAKASSEGLKSP